jgi:4-hydroxybenzoate polyprenyltransferase
MASAARARALALSCHPIPSLAVTAMTAGLAALADLPIGRGALATAAIFTGQLSIGWSNDYLDADRDRTVQRADKPIAAGALTPRAALSAALLAAAVTVVLSVALGGTAGILAVVVMAAGWAYNLGVKATVFSWLPYAIAFGGLPAVLTQAAQPARWPPAWAMVAGALLGVAAHLANVLPDLGDDESTGVRGLPHRLGARATAISAAALLLVASAVILFGPSTGPDLWGWIVFGAAVVLGGTAAFAAYRDPSSKTFFLAVVLIAVIDVVSFAAMGVRL